MDHTKSYNLTGISFLSVSLTGCTPTNEIRSLMSVKLMRSMMLATTKIAKSSKDANRAVSNLIAAVASGSAIVLRQ